VPGRHPVNSRHKSDAEARPEVVQSSQHEDPPHETQYLAGPFIVAE
jgi:hypothetical protein